MCPSSTLFPFYFGVSLFNLDIRKEGTLIIMGLLGNLVFKKMHITPVDRGEGDFWTCASISIPNMSHESAMGTFIVRGLG